MKRNLLFKITVTEEERNLIRGLAERKGLPAPTWARLVLLGHLPQPKPKQVEQAKAAIADTPESDAELRRRIYSFDGAVEPTPKAVGSTEAEQFLSVAEFERAMAPKHSDDE